MVAGEMFFFFGRLMLLSRACVSEASCDVAIAEMYGGKEESQAEEEEKKNMFQKGWEEKEPRRAL